MIGKCPDRGIPCKPSRDRGTAFKLQEDKDVEPDDILHLAFGQICNHGDNSVHLVNSQPESRMEYQVTLPGTMVLISERCININQGTYLRNLK